MKRNSVGNAIIRHHLGCVDQHANINIQAGRRAYGSKFEFSERNGKCSLDGKPLLSSDAYDLTKPRFRGHY